MNAVTHNTYLDEQHKMGRTANKVKISFQTDSVTPGRQNKAKLYIQIEHQNEHRAGRHAQSMERRNSNRAYQVCQEGAVLIIQGLPATSVRVIGDGDEGEPSVYSIGVETEEHGRIMEEFIRLPGMHIVRAPPLQPNPEAAGESGVQPLGFLVPRDQDTKFEVQGPSSFAYSAWSKSVLGCSLSAATTSNKKRAYR